MTLMSKQTEKLHMNSYDQHPFMKDPDFVYRADNTASHTRVTALGHVTTTLLQTVDLQAPFINFYITFPEDWFMLTLNQKTETVVVVRDTQNSNGDISFLSSIPLPKQLLLQEPYGNFFKTIFDFTFVGLKQ